MRVPTVALAVPLAVLACTWLMAVSAEDVADNQVFGGGDTLGKPRKIRSGEELVSAVVKDCLGGEQSTMSCLRLKVLNYLDTVVGARTDAEAARAAADDGRLDKLIAARLARYFNTHEFRMRLRKQEKVSGI